MHGAYCALRAFHDSTMKSLTLFQLRDNRKYTTFVPTTTGPVAVEFRPIIMFGRVDNSIYATNNSEVIEGLKKHREYGSMFYIKEVGKETDGEVKSVAPITPESSLSNPAETIYEDSVTSAATATLWLQKTHGEVFASSKVADMKIEAARKYNTLFPNWK